jgi:hypothetical protein
VTREAVRFVNQTYILQSHFFEERIFKLESDFKSKFNGIAILICNLENSLKQTIDKLQPEELTSRVSLLEEYHLVQKYKNELVSIDEDTKACEEASEWLSQNRPSLINYVLGHIFDHDHRLRQFSEIKVSRESIRSFAQDLDSYLQWIGHYLGLASPPKEMPNGVLNLNLPRELYVEAFKTIRNDKISMDSGLSKRSVIMLKSSINRFLINRKLG